MFAYGTLKFNIDHFSLNTSLSFFIFIFSFCIHEFFFKPSYNNRNFFTPFSMQDHTTSIHLYQLRDAGTLTTLKNLMREQRKKI